MNIKDVSDLHLHYSCVVKAVHVVGTINWIQAKVYLDLTCGAWAQTKHHSINALALLKKKYVDGFYAVKYLYLLLKEKKNCLPIWSLHLDDWFHSYKHAPQTPCESWTQLNKSYSIRKANSQAIIAFHHSALLSLQIWCMIHCWCLRWWCQFVPCESASKQWTTATVRVQNERTDGYMNKEEG